MLDLDGRGNAVGVFGVVLRSTMTKINPPHQVASQRMEQSLIIVVRRQQHQLLPYRVSSPESRAPSPYLHRLSQQRRHDIHHRMIRALPRARIALVWVANDAERRLVD